MNEAEVSVWLEQIPVRLSRTLSVADYTRRVSEIGILFDIDSTADNVGVTYAGAGVEASDQPLLYAIESLLRRRFRHDGDGELGALNHGP